MQSENDNAPRLISVKEAAAITSMSRTLIASLHKEGLFPAPVKLGERRFAFVRAEVNDWVDRKISARAAA